MIKTKSLTKWYIIRDNSNYKEVNKWSNDTFYGGKNHSQGDFPAIVFSDRGIYSPAAVVSGYKKISIEEFRKIISEK